MLTFKNKKWTLCLERSIKFWGKDILKKRMYITLVNKDQELG